MLNAINLVLKKCLDLKENESILIITDSGLYPMAKNFFFACKKLTGKVKLIKIPIPKIHGTEPADRIAEEMLKHDVELLITTKSLSHTLARKNASDKGVRIVTMPGITESTIKRTLDIDYGKLKKINNKLADIMDNGEEVRITTRLGSNLRFSIKNRKAYGRDAGIFNKKGDFGNLPAGEVFIAPAEGTANGIVLVDASFANLGKLEEPLKLYAKNGYACKFVGKKAKELGKLLNSVGKEARNIAEFGIGTNERAVVTGNILEDEKAIGTCHIALGNNIGFGGKVGVQIHLDGIIRNPNIWVDGKKIMDNGRIIA